MKNPMYLGSTYNGGTGTIAGNGSGDILLGSNGTGSRMTLLNNGNVGIGTTSPQATLQVSGSFTVSTSAQTTTPSLYVGTDGNVGVGTSAPSTKLDVVGDLKITTTDNPAGFLFTHIASVPQIVFQYSGVTRSTIEGGAGLGNDLSFTPGSAGNSYLTSGNVGIGTTSPAQALSVSGTASFSSATAVGTTATPSATLDVSGSLKLAGTGDETCDGNRRGTLRINPGSGKLEICRQ